MARKSSTRRSKIIAVVASLALVMGLVPAVALADPDLTPEVTLYTIAATPTPSEGGTVSGARTYNAGEAVNLTATPNDGYAFDCWVENSPNGDWVCSTPEYHFAAEADRTLYARFKLVTIVAPGGGSIDAQVFSGEPIKPPHAVYLDGVDEALQEGTDYTVEYENNVNVGEAKINVTFIGSRVGNGSATFQITAASFEKASVSVADQVYNGTDLTPTPTVTWNDKQVAQEDFKASYADNKYVGTATVTVTGQHNFTNDVEKKATFKITQRPLTVTAESAEREHDGKPLTAGGYSSKGLAEGDRIASAKVEGSQTDVGSSSNKVSDAKVVDADGKDVTANYSISYETGTLTVKAASKTASKGTTAKTGDTLPVVPLVIILLLSGMTLLVCRTRTTR